MRKPLTQTERDDAKRLKSIYENKKNEARAKGVKISQESIALECGWTQGAVGHFLNARTPLNLEAAIKFAKALGVSVADFSPTLAAKLNSSNYNTVEVIGYKEAPVYNFDQLANYHKEAILTKTEPYDARTHSETCFWIEISNDEMDPRFSESDLVLINPDLKPSVGDFVVALVGDQKIGKLRQWRNGGFDNNGIAYSQLLPLNELYPTIDSRFTEFEILGTAVEVKKLLR